MSKQTIKDTSWIDSLQGIFQENLELLFENVFSSIQNVLYNGVSYVIIYTTIMIWLLNILKTGYPTRDDLFKAGKWLIVTCFVYGIFYSYDGYNDFISWLMIPAQWVRSGVAGIFDTSGDSFGEIVTNAVNVITEIKEKLFTHAVDKVSRWYAPDAMAEIVAYTKLLAFWIFYASFWFVLIGVVAVIVSSTFIALLILAMAPMVIPFLTINFLKPYFFSWLKLFISYSLYAPIALIVLNIAMSPIAQSKNLIQQGQIEILYNNQIQYFLVPTLTSILCIYLFKQIPNWISQILGVSGLQNAGTTAAAGFATGAATVGISTLAGGIIGRQLAKSAGENTMGGMLKGMGKGFANSAPFGKSLMESFSKSNKSTEIPGKGLSVIP